MAETTRRHGVGSVARLAGTTVRTLHHYEAVGLLVPSARSDAGYRLYDDADLERLTRILYYRALGFSLDDIAAALADPTDLVDHLRRQHRLLTEQLGHVRELVAAIEKELEAHMTGDDLTAEERLAIFGEHHAERLAEAEQRWGDTDAWRQSSERTATFTADDWRRSKAAVDALEAALAEAFTRGVHAGSPEADALADAHLESVRTYYDADRAMQRSLADTYVTDARFRRHDDDIAPGLAGWLRDVVHAAPEVTA